MLVFHRTPTENVDAIISEGFRDRTASYGTNAENTGVWVSADEPLTSNEGAKGDCVLWTEIPEDVFAQYEWQEDGKPYREALIPAMVLNRYTPVFIFDHDLKGSTREEIERLIASREKAAKEVDKESDAEWHARTARRLRDTVLPFLEKHALLEQPDDTRGEPILHNINSVKEAIDALKDFREMLTGHLLPEKTSVTFDWSSNLPWRRARTLLSEVDKIVTQDSPHKREWLIVKGHVLDCLDLHKPLDLNERQRQDLAEEIQHTAEEARKEA